MSYKASDYQQYFDPKEFLNTFYANIKYPVHGYKKLDRFWSQNKGKDLKVLEYGSGPVVSQLVSACPHVKDFVLAEYLEANRKAVQAWIDKDPKAFDWRPTFDFIVRELEGKDPDEVPKREDELRQKIRAIVPCDLKADNILDIPDCLQEKYGPPYDVVGSTFCIESVVESKQEYKASLVKMTKFLKPGGYLLLCGTLEETHFIIGSKTYHSFPLTKEFVLESMKEAGLKDVQIDLESCNGSVTGKEDRISSDANDAFFAFGRV